VSKRKPITGVLSGVSGEYFVAAQLSRLGYIATITLKNTEGVDLLVTKESAQKSVAIQVKTDQGAGKSWVLNRKDERRSDPNLYYVFVSLKKEEELPDFHIVPSKVVADQIKRDHARWLKTPGRKGQAHNDTSMRRFEDKQSKYVNAWNILKL
jgi:hypothetical protein